MTKASVAQMEKREAEGTVTLNSVQKLAGAMEADLYYLVLPRCGLEEAMRGRAESLARRLAKDVSDSMALEGQATGDDRLQELIELHTTRLLDDERALWDDV